VNGAAKQKLTWAWDTLEGCMRLAGWPIADTLEACIAVERGLTQLARGRDYAIP
jgi:hypothetical protein